MRRPRVQILTIMTSNHDYQSGIVFFENLMKSGQQLWGAQSNHMYQWNISHKSINRQKAVAITSKVN